MYKVADKLRRDMSSDIGDHHGDSVLPPRGEPRSAECGGRMVDSDDHRPSMLSAAAEGGPCAGHGCGRFGIRGPQGAAGVPDGGALAARFTSESRVQPSSGRTDRCFSRLCSRDHSGGTKYVNRCRSSTASPSAASFLAPGPAATRGTCASGSGAGSSIRSRGGGRAVAAARSERQCLGGTTSSRRWCARSPYTCAAAAKASLERWSDCAAVRPQWAQSFWHDIHTTEALGTLTDSVRVLLQSQRYVGPFSDATPCVSEL